jgi:UDP-glucuronate decarboxylase
MATGKGESMKRVLVTGSGGWIGRHCVPLLKEKGYEVIMPKVNLIGDDPQLMPNLQRLRCTHLLHLAWETTPDKYWESPLNHAWFEASIRLFQAVMAGGGERIVVAGTCAEITTLYGKTKDALRRVLDAYSDATGINGAYGKIYYLYGPYEKPERFIPSMIRSLLQGKEYSINHSTQMVDFFHVQDVAGALVAILDSDISGTVEIGDGRPTTLRRIGMIVAEKIGRPDLIKFGEMPNPKYLAADLNRLRAELNWSPKYDIYTGLEDTIKWWRGNFIPEDNYE